METFSHVPIQLRYRLFKLRKSKLIEPKFKVYVSRKNPLKHTSVSREKDIKKSNIYYRLVSNML